MTIIEKLQVIFREVFDDENLLLVSETNASSIDEWDSLAHIRLILAIEKSFGLHFNAYEIENLENVGQMVDLIIDKQTNDK